MPHPTLKLGRHVEHDPRSLAHPAPQAAILKSVLWAHHAPVLDQGRRSSCTGNAVAQLLNTDALLPARKKVNGGKFLTEADALKIYSLGTTFDAFPGSFPPTDTGSSGLAVAKAAQQLGYVASYKHAFGVDHMIAALQLHPLIVGTDWFDAMYTPDPNGFVAPGGKLDGGHEYCCLGVNLDGRQFGGPYFEFLNSWADGWGLKGRFRVLVSRFAPLLATDGDVTVLVGSA